MLGGFGAPLFLLLAGVVGLAVGRLEGAADRRRRRRRRAPSCGAGSRSSASRSCSASRRGSWAGRSPRTLLRVDILNIMGPAIVAAAALWGAVRRPRARGRSLRRGDAGDHAADADRADRIVARRIPDPLEAYLRPAGAYSGFHVLSVGRVRVRRRLRRGAARSPGAARPAAETRVNIVVRRRRRAARRRGLRRHRFCRRFTPDRTSGPRRRPSSCSVSACSMMARRPGVRLGTAAVEPRRVELGPAARAHLALHLLDPCRAGLRADLDPDPPPAHVRAGVRGAGPVQWPDAPGVDRQGPVVARRQAAARAVPGSRPATLA